MRTRASAGDDFDLWHLLFVNVTFLDLCPADFSLQIHSDVPFIFYTLLTFALQAQRARGGATEAIFYHFEANFVLYTHAHD